MVGKICSERQIGRETVKTTMEKIWKVRKPMEFRETGLNYFVIVFAKSIDKYRFMDGYPWLFDNFLFVLKNFDGNT